MNKQNMSYWNKIRIGSIIQLDDQQTLEFLIEEGLSVSSNGADFEVVRIKELSLNDGSVKMKIVYIQLKDIVWYLIVNDIEGDIKLKIYYQPEDFTCGNRDDVIKNEFFELFEQPEEEDYVASDLIFATDITLDDIEYKTFYGVMYGSSTEDGEEDFATVVELSTETECEDTDLLIIELCNVEVEEQLDDDGYTEADPIVDIDSSDSFVMYLKGCSVEMNDVEILN